MANNKNRKPKYKQDNNNAPNFGYANTCPFCMYFNTMHGQCDKYPSINYVDTYWGDGQVCDDYKDDSDE